MRHFHPVLTLAVFAAALAATGFAAFAGGLSQGVARRAMCEDMLSHCRRDPAAFAACKPGTDCRERLPAETVDCLQRYETCLALPRRPGPHQRGRAEPKGD